MFILFVEPSQDQEKCGQWIVACVRKFFTEKNISRNTYICALHWPGESGPTEEFPDPLKANLTPEQASRAFDFPFLSWAFCSWRAFAANHFPSSMLGSRFRRLPLAMQSLTRFNNSPLFPLCFNPRHFSHPFNCSTVYSSGSFSNFEPGILSFIYLFFYLFLFATQTNYNMMEKNNTNQYTR